MMNTNDLLLIIISLVYVLLGANALVHAAAVLDTGTIRAHNGTIERRVSIPKPCWTFLFVQELR